jgi:hypothetical protein
MVKKKVESEKANFGCLAASFKKIMVLEFHSRIRVRHEHGYKNSFLKTTINVSVLPLDFQVFAQ